MNIAAFRRLLWQAAAVPLLGLLLMAAFVLWQFWRLNTAEQWLDHSDRVSTQLRTLERLMLDQETGLRGFQLTGDERLLEPYNAASQHIGEAFAGLKSLVADNPDQTAKLADLHDRYELWLGFAQPVIAEERATHRAAANPGVPVKEVLRGKAMMDDLRASSYRMRATEGTLRQSRFQQVQSLEARTMRALLLAALLAGVAIASFVISRMRLVSRLYQRALGELEQRARELETSEGWLRTTLQSIGDAVITCDQSGQVDFMNPVAQRLTGWPLTEAQGLPLTQVFHIVDEETRESSENPVEKVRRLNAVVALANHTILLSRDKREYVIDDSAAPIRDRDGAIAGIVLVFRDVTTQRRSAAALLSNEKLALAGRLAASIAHEIHNPLDSVANLHYLLSQEEDAAKRAEYLGMAQQELSRTLQISRTLLSLYREPKAPVPVNLGDLLDSVLLLLERRLSEQHVEVERRYSETLPVEGFPAELRQVLTNTIMNAAEAVAPAGRIRITLEPAPAEEFHGTGATIEILDTGAGIPPEVAGNLFQPFFTTKGERGTGLGLWVSLGIVQKHGGMLRIDNSTNPEYPGACVSIFLPRHTLATQGRRRSVYSGQ